MKKYLVLMVAFFIAFAFMATGAMAGGSVYANKIIGDTGMTYDLNLNEDFGRVNVFADADFSSDIDGVTKIDTDEISGGVKVMVTDAVRAGVKYSENYRGDNTIELLTVDGSYTLGNGVSLRLKTERDMLTKDYTTVGGVGYAW